MKILEHTGIPYLRPYEDLASQPLPLYLLMSKPHFLLNASYGRNWHAGFCYHNVLMVTILGARSPES